MILLKTLHRTLLIVAFGILGCAAPSGGGEIGGPSSTPFVGPFRSNQRIQEIRALSIAGNGRLRRLPLGTGSADEMLRDPQQLFAIDDVTLLGTSGDLRLELFENRLLGVTFFPRRRELLLSKLTELGLVDVDGAASQRPPSTRIEWLLDGEKRWGVMWSDMSMVRRRNAWINRR